MQTTIQILLAKDQQRKNKICEDYGNLLISRALIEV